MTTFEDLLQRGNLNCAHHTNIQGLVIELYKVNKSDNEQNISNMECKL